jgi:hypothetical protein
MRRLICKSHHRQGWKLVSAYPYIFRFAACQLESFVYEIDFAPTGRQEREQRIALYADYGWEHVLDYMQFSSFRKEATKTMRTEDQMLYSDNESKLELAQRIFRRRMLPLSILLLATIPLMAARVLLGGPMDAGDITLYVIYVLLLAWDAYALVRCARGFAHLREKYGRPGNR